MVKRVRAETEGGDQYGLAPPSGLQFISSGCRKLDCDLGGGWPLGRVSNVVGDASTGKTLLAIEAAANFVRDYEGFVEFDEAEAAFDRPYAEGLGLDMRRVKLKSVDTVEDIEARLSRRIDLCLQKNVPGLFIWDSIDATTDKAEQETAFDKGSYGGSKPKQIGKLFRSHVRGLREANIHLMCISQTRDKIGVTFGEKHTRSGGKALQFYASQVLWLSHLGQIHKTVAGVKRTIGIEIRGKVKKNKIGVNYREANFNIEFGFGIDDLQASVAWLQEIGRLADVGLDGREGKKVKVESYLSSIRTMDSKTYASEAKRIGKVIPRVWKEVETAFLPTRKKY